MFAFFPYLIGVIGSKKCRQKLGFQKKDKIEVGLQVAYRGQVQTNLQIDSLLMFDATIGRPKYFN